MMNKKTLLILQIAWIIVGLLCVYAAFHSTIDGTRKMTILFSLMGIASFVMAYFRYIQRKKK